MTSVWSAILEELRGAISAAVPTIAPKLIRFEVPPDPSMGDIAVPCFIAGRITAQDGPSDPREIAARIAEAIGAHPLVARATVAGLYVNIVLESAELARRVLAAVAETGERYGDSVPSPSRSPLRARGPEPEASQREGEKVALEFVSPNANKPLHLGHLRNAFLGEAIARCLEAQGHTVHRVCLVNDRGVHIMKSLIAYHHWGKGATPESENLKGDHFVGNWYVRFEEENRKQRDAALPYELPAPTPSGSPSGRGRTVPAGGGEREGEETETSLEREATEWLRRWEAGDLEVRRLWTRMTDWVLAGFRESYATIGVAFAREYRESEIYEDGRRIVADALGRDIFRLDAKGNIVAPLKDRFGLDDKVVERADGTTVYATQDLALATAKARDLHPDRSIIITGNEQDYYFKQLFAIFELLGMTGADQNTHRSYGMVELPEGKMKSREGTVVDADDLIAELTRLAEEEIRKRADIVPGEPAAGTTEPEVLVSDEALARAKDIALAAIRFYLLLVSPETTVTFDPKASLAFTGKTGPYVQYMHARICSIQRKAQYMHARICSIQRRVAAFPPAPPLPAGRGETKKSFSPSSLEGERPVPAHASGEGVAALLSHPTEKQLLLRIARFPDVVAAAADQLDPSGVAQYVYDLAKTFADFYRDVPVLSARGGSASGGKAPSLELRDARLALCDAVRVTLARGLTLFGIAPLSEM